MKKQIIFVVIGCLLPVLIILMPCRASNEEIVIPREIPKEKVMEIKQIGSIICIKWRAADGNIIQMFYNTRYADYTDTENYNDERKNKPDDNPSEFKATYLEEIVNKAIKTLDYQDVVSALTEVMEDKWWQISFWDDSPRSLNGLSLGETEGNKLLQGLALTPYAYEISTVYLDWAAKQQENLRDIRMEIRRFDYLTRLDNNFNQINDAIGFLEHLLNRDWASPRAKENTIEVIRESISSLKESLEELGDRK